MTAVPGVRTHLLREVGPLVGFGLPRTRRELALIRAAQWASTDKQAATLIAMTVQQRLVSPQALMDHWAQVTYSPRRALMNDVIADVCNGSHSLSELEFVHLCRRYGLPTPSRQVLRQGERGRIYLDAFFDDWGVHVEIQGVQHLQGLAPVEDALRFNHLGLTNQALVSLHIPVLGLRVSPKAFMDQVARALRANGWVPRP